MTHPRHLLLATLLAAASTWSLAQTAPATPAPASPAATAQATPADGNARAQRWAERRAKHMDQLKAQLKLSAAQEGAWSTYTAALQPPAHGPRMDRDAMAQLTTPQRIDRMQAMQAERQQHMSQRADAIKAFYAQLTPEQQKVYDQQTLRRDHGKRMQGGHGMHHS